MGKVILMHEFEEAVQDALAWLKNPTAAAYNIPCINYEAAADLLDRITAESGLEITASIVLDQLTIARPSPSKK